MSGFLKTEATGHVSLMRGGDMDKLAFRKMSPMAVQDGLEIVFTAVNRLLGTVPGFVVNEADKI